MSEVNQTLMKEMELSYEEITYVLAKKTKMVKVSFILQCTKIPLITLQNFNI